MRSDVDERQLCEGCGDDRGLMEVDSLVLCRTCREDYYAKNRLDHAKDFIFHDEMDQKLFLKDWFFGGLDRAERMEVLQKAFADMLHGMRRDQAEDMMKRYVLEQKDAYGEYLDKALHAREIRE